jgi:transposase
MTYSVQFRKKVLKLEELGESFINLSKRFKISITTITRWKKQFIPKDTRNKQPVKIKEDSLKKDVEQYPNSFSYERAKRLGVSASGIKYAMKRLKISYKKKPKSSKSGSRKKIYILPKD